MDLIWKTAAWDATGKQTRCPAFFYHADRQAFALQISQAAECDRKRFMREKHCPAIQTEEEWDDYLEEVLQPDSAPTEASLSLVIFPRHPDPEHAGKRIRNPSNLRRLPIPSEAVFKRLVDRFHIHQAIQMIINRGWPAILKSENHSGGADRKIIYFNLRTSNTLEFDTALSMTHMPSQRRTYAILFGYTPRQVSGVLERLAYAEHAAVGAAAEPLTLINAFIHLEKVVRFEQVERHADSMADLVSNFPFVIASSSSSPSSAAAAASDDDGPAHADDPHDLVGLAANVTLLRNGLVSWAKEMQRFEERERAAGASATAENGEPGFPLFDRREYLERTADEYAAMVRKCEGLLAQVSMAFQMETSSVARQEVNKMKALAILTMIFLPATFAATFMSMGLFNWHPKEGEPVLSPWWHVYFIIAGGLTGVVFILYFFWSRITEVVLRRSRKLYHIICYLCSYGSVYGALADRYKRGR